MRSLPGRRWLVPLAAMIVCVGLGVGFLHYGLQPSQQPAADNSLSAPSAPAAKTPASGSPAPKSSGPTAGKLVPTQLIINKIRVKAVVDSVTVDEHNDMAPPTRPSHVGWYSPGVVPGQPGDAVIDGHVDWYGVPQAVFFKLDKLKPGDTIVVVGDHGQKLRFRVTHTQRVDADSHPHGLFAQSGPARLTLITCTGAIDPKTDQYSQRLLVNATLEDKA